MAKNRCTNRNSQDFATYGERGIKFCFPSFQAFLKEIGHRPSPKHSVNRIDNQGDYAPGNIQWSTATEQSRNRRSNRTFVINGEERSMAEWAEIYHMNYKILWKRLSLGWNILRALTQPIKHVHLTKS